ncbi:tyrosine-type recombinase/integrase [Mangrovimonas cancribranchiae]|uniref:Tyrosine-type recombinase/integrase n=1 Tax=Mangrovimonas cancribranchiae TaxID=3080055 RepID=A0AAU6NXJ0_9FLAO
MSNAADKYLRRILATETNTNYSEPKLYIPQKKVNGRTVANVNADWYVYYYFRDNNGKMTGPFKVRKQINRLKSVEEKRSYGTRLAKGLSTLLYHGYSPLDKQEFNFDARTNPKQPVGINKDDSLTLEKALNDAIVQKSLTLKPTTIKGYTMRVNKLLEWLRKNKLKNIAPNEFNFEHALSYIDYESDQGNKATSVDNTRRELSAIFRVLKKRRLIDHNHFSEIETSKSAPEVHQVYTKKQLVALKKYLVKHDLNLYYFFKFIMFTYLRNKEVAKLKVKNFDLDRAVVAIETKTENITYKPLTKDLISLLENVYDIRNKPREHYIFTKEAGKTGYWDISDEGKTAYFSNRFKTIREQQKDFNLTKDHTIYSSRHTITSDIFMNFINEGLNEREAIIKLMGITGHSSENALKKYLRSIGAILPKKSSNYTTIDF